MHENQRSAMGERVSHLVIKIISKAVAHPVSQQVHLSVKILS